jgi:DNA invertase Pin-like site-specific DNA recombinase
MHTGTIKNLAETLFRVQTFIKASQTENRFLTMKIDDFERLLEKTARSEPLTDLVDALHELHSRTVVTLLDNSANKQNLRGAYGKGMIDMIKVLMDFERELYQDALTAQMDRAVQYRIKADTVRENKIRRQIKKLAAEGMGGTAIAKQLKISRTSVYRLLNGEATES